VTQKQVTNNVPALAAGTYEFWCEIHPDMKGTLTAG
jgi:plastocyanin